MVDGRGARRLRHELRDCRRNGAVRMAETSETAIPENWLAHREPLPEWARVEWQAAVNRMQQHSFGSVPSYNPYWDAHGKTFEDADGYRVVLQNASWDP